jgi:hypothetical protein
MNQSLKNREVAQTIVETAADDIYRIKAIRQELRDVLQIWKSILACAEMQSPEEYMAIRACHGKWWKLFLAQNPKADDILKKEKLMKKLLCKIRKSLKNDMKEAKFIGLEEYKISNAHYEDFERDFIINQPDFGRINTIQTNHSTIQFEIYSGMGMSN